MQPWMIIAILMGLCVALLLVAPRLHRHSVERAVSRAEASRHSRADNLRSAPTSVERAMPSVSVANRVHDALLLRGVRAEIVREGDRHLLLYHEADAAVVDAVIDDDPSRG